MRNLLSRKAGSLAQTALAGHRTIGGHARGPRMALRPRQFLGHFGAGPEEHLVRRLSTMPSSSLMTLVSTCQIWFGCEARMPTVGLGG